eukprot:m.130631 g.130631  ORF g.130631 m.130631 type:complete len:212 (+) comp9453_c1_seq1:3009-3644(+)
MESSWRECIHRFGFWWRKWPRVFVLHHNIPGPVIAELVQIARALGLAVAATPCAAIAERAAWGAVAAFAGEGSPETLAAWIQGHKDLPARRIAVCGPPDFCAAVKAAAGSAVISALSGDAAHIATLWPQAWGLTASTHPLTPGALPTSMAALQFAGPQRPRIPPIAPRVQPQWHLYMALALAVLLVAILTARFLLAEIPVVAVATARSAPR